MTLSRIASKQSAYKEGFKLSRKTVMAFYGFTKIAATNDLVMKAFFQFSTGPLRKLTRS
jgi:farnesyl-diphosphate farnesyltransferase